MLFMSRYSLPFMMSLEKRGADTLGINNTPFGLSKTSATLPKAANAHAVLV